MEFPDKSQQQPAVSASPSKNIKPVITGATQVSRPATKRFKDFLFAESPRELGAKIGRDVIVPRIKAGFEEAANSFLAGMLWGDSANRPLSNMVKGTVLRGGGINYNQISTTMSPLAQAQQATQTRSTGNYKDIVCPSQQSAEFLLANMYDLLNQYRVVTVGDLYELANISPEPSDNARGWVSLDGARISKVREGFVLELPRPSLI